MKVVCAELNRWEHKRTKRQARRPLMPQQMCELSVRVDARAKCNVLRELKCKCRCRAVRMGKELGIEGNHD